MSRHTLPPLPSEIIERREKLERAEALIAAKQQPPALDADLEELLRQLQGQNKAGAPLAQREALLGQVQKKGGIVNSITSALHKLTLPFDAFAESINALIGPAVPQEAFQRRSARSRTILKTMLTGEVSPAEAAGLLREVFEERSSVEQILTSFFFDPLNVVIPAAVAVKGGKGLTLAARGAKAGTAGLEFALPFVGGPIATKLGIRDIARRLKVAGGAEDAETVNDAVFRAAGFEKFFDPALSKNLGTENVHKLIAAAKNAEEEAALRLSFEVGGRPAEVGRLIVSDFDAQRDTVLFFSKDRSQVRDTVQLDKKTADLLRGLVRGKAGSDPIFTNVKGELATGKGYNQLLNRVAKRAGLTVRSNELRRASLDSLAAAFQSVGLDLELVGKFAGHTARTFRQQITAQYVGPNPRPIIETVKRFVKPVEDDFDYIPLKTVTPKVAEQIGEVGRKLKREAKLLNVAATIGRKSKFFIKGVTPRLLARGEGPGKLDALDIDPKWVERAASLSDDESSILLNVAKIVEGKEELKRMTLVDNLLSEVAQGAGARTPFGKNMIQLTTKLQTDSQALAAGMLDRLVKMGLHEDLGKVPQIIGRLVDRGLIDAEASKYFLAALGDAGDSILRRLNEVSAWSNRFAAHSKAQVIALRSAVEEAGDPLKNLEGLTKVKVETLVDEWIRIREVREALRRVGLSLTKTEKEIAAGDPTFQITTDLYGLASKLWRLAQPGRATATMFGADMAKFEVETRRARTDFVAQQLFRRNFVNDTQEESLRLAKLLAPKGAEGFREPPKPPGRGKVGGEPISPIPPSSSDAFIQSLFPGVRARIAEVIQHAVRPAERTAKWLEHQHRTRTEGAIGLQAFTEQAHRVVGLVGLRLFDTLGMRGSVAQGGTKVVLAHKGQIFQVVEETAQGRVMLEGTPQIRALRALGDAEIAPQYFIGLKMKPGWETTAPGKFIVATAKAKGLDPELVAKHIRTVLDGQAGVLIKNLDEVYDMPADVKEGIIMMRRWWAQGQAEAVNIGISLPKALKVKHPHPEHFPFIANTKATSTLPDVNAQELLADGFWQHKRVEKNAAQAIHDNVVYHDFMDSAAYAVSDIQRWAHDQELIQHLADTGFFGSLTQLKTADEAAIILERLQKVMAETGDVGNAFEDLAKLQEFRRTKDTVLAEAGNLADAVLKSQESAKAAAGAVSAFRKLQTERLAAARAVNKITKQAGLGSYHFSDTAEGLKVAKALHEFNKSWLTLAKATNKISAVSRFMQAGFDVSAPFIHGFLAFSSHTPEWLKSAREMYKAVFNTENLGVYLRQNHADVLDLVGHGGVMNIVEPVEAAQGVAKFLGHAPIVGGLLGQGAYRAQAGFTAWQDVLKVELWKSLKRSVGDNPTDLHRLGAYVNKMSGVYNPALNGIPPLQRYLEGSFLSFAPMYRRASFGLLVSALSGGADRRLVHKDLIRMLGVAGLFGYMLEKTGNNEKALDPASPQFMAVKVGDSYIGIGTAFYSLIRAATAVAEQAMDEERRGQLLAFNVTDNSLLRWWRSQAPPIPSSMIDVLTGRTYIGEPLTGEDGTFTKGMAAMWALRQVTPFTVEAMINEWRGPESLVVASEGMGLRSFPESLQGQQYHLRRNYLELDNDPNVVAWRAAEKRAGRKPSWAKLPQLLRDRITKKYPDLTALADDIQKQTIRLGKPERARQALYFEEIGKKNEYVQAKMEQLGTQYEKGLISSKEFRTQFQQLQFANRALSESVAGKPEYQAVIADLEEQKDAFDPTDPEARFIGDHLFNLFYRDVVNNPAHTNEDGMFLFDVYQKALLEFQLKYGMDVYKYIQERQKEKREFPSVVEEFIEAKELLRDYWQLPETIFVGDNLAHVKNYLHLSSRDAAIYAKKYPVVKLFIRRLEKRRERFRLAHPDLDWLLVKWYDASPRTKFATTRLAGWQDSQRRTALTSSAY